MNEELIAKLFDYSLGKIEIIIKNKEYIDYKLAL